MICASCGAENREGSNFCRYCSAPLAKRNAEPTSGYIPSVPPPPGPGESSQSGYYQQNYQTPPSPPARSVVPPLHCPRCNSINVVKGTIPLWAVLIAIIGAIPTCLLSLLFLLIKDPHKCINCELEFK